MDETTESFAYRCLPLNIANSHGWVLESACDFTAWWDGSDKVQGVQIASDAPACREPMRHYGAPCSHFGHGVLTFHVGCLFRTDPRVNLWVSGPPNEYKDGIVALSGIIETDWAPVTFTMNWRFIRPNTVVSFHPGEPICFFFPLVSRHMMEATQPEFHEPELAPSTAPGSTIARRFIEISPRRDHWHSRWAGRSITTGHPARRTHGPVRPSKSADLRTTLALRFSHADDWRRPPGRKCWCCPQPAPKCLTRP